MSGSKQIKPLCFLLCVSGQGLVRGPSSLRKKVELSEDQVLDAVMEDSSTSLAPTILYLTTFEAAPATKESPILPVTSLWPQVRGFRMTLELEASLRPHHVAQEWDGIGENHRSWLDTRFPNGRQPGGGALS